MEKKNKGLILFVLCLIVIIIGIATIVKVYKNHINNLYKVTEKRIEEQAKKCFLDEICTGSETTIGFLTQNGYLKDEIDPVSKEYLDEKLIIKCSDYNCGISLH